jgi:two-component system chemotaxis sensor kinase CheA
MLNMAEIISVFLNEAQELVDQLEQGLLALDRQPTQVSAEDINAMFRAAHTIKGSAGVVGLDHIVDFTHLVETAFEQLRSGQLLPEKTLIQLLLICTDHINALLQCAAQQAEPSEDILQTGAQLLQQLRPRLQLADAAAPEPVVTEKIQAFGWRVFLQPAASCFTDGLDPLALCRYLRNNSQQCEEFWYCTNIAPLSETSVALAETCQLSLELQLIGIEHSVLVEALDFIRQDSICAIFAPDSSWQEQQQFLQTLTDQPLASLLRARWQKTHKDDSSLQVTQSGSVEPTPGSAQMKDNNPLRDIAVQPGRVQKVADQRMMRLPAYKLDTLVNQLGELLIATATLHEHSRRLNQPEIIEQVQQVQLLVDDIQNSALQLRMVQIGETFNRFQRVVHDIAAELGKDVQLVIEGADAELDKSVVERISDPLMHLVRNALDHGLETPAQRQQQGKTAQGTLLLRAYHDSGSIVIEISDDGRGIDREKVRQKAIDRGLISAASELSHRQIDELIFEPGFSTADAVSNLSGRGVGMDVVKRNIEALRGTVDINSEPGSGTRFHLRLPLTLAIIDGFMVRIAGSKFVIPLDMVNECIELPTGQEQATAGAGYLNLRGEVLPFIHLDQLFGLGSTSSERRSIVVVRYGKQSAGLVVDQLLGEFQTVIKPLGKLFQFLQGISGSSILGSGDIALILDIPRLVQIHMQATERQRTTMII